MKIDFGAGRLDIKDIAALCGGYLIPASGSEVYGICTDSREAAPGVLFVALVGERTDGHDHIKDAVSRGCDCVLAERYLPDDAPEASFVIAQSVQDALMTLASEYRKRVDCIRIGITGSVGKTTTKEFIHSVLSVHYITHKTSGNYNSLIGMPLTLAETPAGVEVSVLEMAMSGLGEISKMSLVACPDIAVITNIGTSHMEMLGSRENICRAKLEILDGLKSDGIAIINGDEPLLSEKTYENKNVVSVSLCEKSADYYAYNIRYIDNSTVFNLKKQERDIYDIAIPALGEHNVYAALFAWAVADRLNMTEAEIRRGLIKYKSADMRQKISETNGITVIEDCYNASPESMRAAIKVLCGIKKEKSGRAIALLGDMKELGINSEEFHRDIGAYAYDSGVDLLFTLGMLSRYIAAGALAAGMGEDNVFVNIDEDTYAATAAEIYGVLRSGDVLLVKASRALRAERVIKCLEDIIKGSESQ